MQSKLAVAFLLLLFFVPFAHAQSTNLQPLWDAISNIGIAIQAIQQDIQTIQTVGLQFAQEVSTRLNNLESQVTTIQEVGTQVILDMNASIASLQTRDENLQAQISAIPPVTQTIIARNKIYEVVNTSLSKIANCNDSDDILLNAYCIGGYGEIVPLNQILFDNFNDGDYTLNPTWTLLSGSFVVGVAPSGPNKLVVNSAGLSEIITPTSFTSVPLLMEADITTNNGGAQMYIALTDSPSPIVAGNGYMLGYFDNLSGSTALVLYRIENGTFTYLSIIQNVPWAPQQETLLGMYRDVVGNWTVKVSGISYPTGINDANYTNFNYTHLRYVAAPNDAGAFDNVRVQNGDSNVFTSAFVNINDYNAPMGIRCLNNGSARVMCLQQP